MRSTNPDFEDDVRHFLYREYLRIIADHRPPVFVMENVKGILSAQHSGKKIIGSILSDLRKPDMAVKNGCWSVAHPAKLIHLSDARVCGVLILILRTTCAISFTKSICESSRIIDLLCS